MFGSQIGAYDLSRLCQRVGMSLRAGLPIKKVWEAETRRGGGTHRKVMEEIHEHVSEGGTVSDAFRNSRGYFPRLAIAMVEIGEHTGRLERVFLRLGDHYDHQVKMVREFLGGIAWPAIQLGAAVLIIGGMIWIFGMIASMTGGDPIDITGLGLVGNTGVVQYFFWVAMIILYTAGMVYAISRGMLGPLPVRLAMYLPFAGPCLRQLAMARLCWSLGMALDAGVDAKKSVLLAIDSTQNPFYISRGPLVAEGIDAHREFYESFRDASGFPTDFLDLLQAAEISGTLSETLERMSSDYEEEARRSMRTLVMAASSLVWMGTVTFIVMAIFRVAMIYINALNSALEGL
jgi:type IV pilus assembly protein PilC